MSGAQALHRALDLATRWPCDPEPVTLCSRGCLPILQLGQEQPALLRRPGLRSGGDRTAASGTSAAGAAAAAALGIPPKAVGATVGSRAGERGGLAGLRDRPAERLCPHRESAEDRQLIQDHQTGHRAGDRRESEHAPPWVASQRGDLGCRRPACSRPTAAVCSPVETQLRGLVMPVTKGRQSLPRVTWQQAL